MSKFPVFLLLFCLNIGLHSQILNPEISWFEPSGFFFPEELAKNNIREINIHLSEKKDADIIRNSATSFEYIFNSKGYLSSGKKRSKIGSRIDSSIVLFSYSNSNLPYKKAELNGPFHFSYYLFYNDNEELEKKIKIDLNSAKTDTLFIRYYKTVLIGNLKKTTVFNEINKAFQILSSKWIGSKTKRTERVEYIRNQCFTEKVFWFLNLSLIHI